MTRPYWLKESDWPWWDWLTACREATGEERERLIASRPEWHFSLPATVESPVPNLLPGREKAITRGPSEEQWDEWNQIAFERDHGPEI